MRVAALVPTRNRASTVHRAVFSFLDALKTAGTVEFTRLVIVDDSDVPEEVDALDAVADEIRSTFADIKLEVLASKLSGVREPTVASPGSGPGVVRNRGLKHLRAGPVDHDVTILFDDDVCFNDVKYRGSSLECDGVQLLRNALKFCGMANTVVGCGYVGRQDLSILEHICLNTGEALSAIAPAMAREGIENVAPGGISTAFLAIMSPAHRLPDFPSHYNEDYVWLHALDRSGWPLRRVEPFLAHVPPGDVLVTAPALSFQIFGEIVWLAVGERERFPHDAPYSLAAAIGEVVGDVRDLAANGLAQKCWILDDIISEVVQHFEALRDAMLSGHTSVQGMHLKQAIEAGLALRPRY